VILRVLRFSRPVWILRNRQLSLELRKKITSEVPVLVPSYRGRRFFSGIILLVPTKSKFSSKNPLSSSGKYAIIGKQEPIFPFTATFQMRKMIVFWKIKHRTKIEDG
jgi:hypothetical protein